MPRSGGTYVQPANTDAVANTTASSSDFNDVIDDLGNEITASLPVDGTKAMAAALPMGGFKITNLGDATLTTDAVNLGQVQTGYQPLDAFLEDIADLADPGADRVLFWDDSAGILTWLTMGTNLSISTTTLNASGGAGSTDWGLIGGTLSDQTDLQTALDGKLATSGGTDLAIADGGTAASTAATAFGNLKQNATTSATGVTEMATAAEFRANTATAHLALSPAEVWTAAAEVALSDGATIAVDWSLGINFTVTLGGNRTLGNGTNEKAGQSGVIRVVQDGTGSRTLAYASDYEFAGGSAPVLSTAAAAEDLLFYYIVSSTRVVITGILKAIA
jgi:hypothetical protein